MRATDVRTDRRTERGARRASAEDLWAERTGRNEDE